MSVVRIKIGPIDAQVFSPFEAKDLIRSMPVRSWSSTGRYWSIPVRDVEDLQAVLEEAGFHVIVIGDTRQREQHEPPPSNGRQSTGTWADSMFTALGPALSEKAFKALVRVVHPDTGGSTALMQQLNAARDRHGTNR